MFSDQAKRIASKTAISLAVAGTIVVANADSTYAQTAKSLSLPYSTVTIQTSNGYVLTAVNGGGVSPSESVALHTNATSIGAWEEFTCVALGPNRLAFQTMTGNYVTAVNGGGLGDPNAITTPIHANATNASTWETFKIQWLAGGKCALQTSNGNYVTAVDGGGWGATDAADAYPIHTNATTIGAWETFTINY
jgi:hypothetical protein